jgi:hypothetical protein
MDDNMYSLGMGHLASAPPNEHVPIVGASVSVRLLRKNGVKLSKAEREAQEPLVGEMTIAPFMKDASASIGLEAMLFNSTGNLRYNLHKCLFDPRVISMDVRGTVYRGFEREVIDGKMIEFVQVWLVMPRV